MIKITSDSTCDLSPELLKKYDIEIIPLHIIKAGKDYIDCVSIFPADIFKHVNEGGDLCTTSAINVGEYTERFERLSKQYDAVIHVCISADFSSCYQNACTAAKQFDNVYVIDSRNLSSGHGHIVVEAAIMAQEGLAPKEICQKLNDLTSRVEASFLIDRLDYMVKGGRCSAVAALGANLLKLKPCIEVVDGKMKVGKKYRGSFANCLKNYVRDRLEDRDDLKLDRIFITHPAADSDAVEATREAITEVADFKEIIETQTACTVACHCGPNTVGILFIRIDNNKN